MGPAAAVLPSWSPRRATHTAQTSAGSEMGPTKFSKGDLVWVWHSIINNDMKPGIVMDVRPWVHGGSGVQSRHESYGSPAKSSQTTHEPKRSEYLVVSPTGDFQSWFDEKNIFGESSGAG